VTSGTKIHTSSHIYMHVSMTLRTNHRASCISPGSFLKTFEILFFFRATFFLFQLYGPCLGKYRSFLEII